MVLLMLFCVIFGFFCVFWIFDDLNVVAVFVVSSVILILDFESVVVLFFLAFDLLLFSLHNKKN